MLDVFILNNAGNHFGFNTSHTETELVFPMQPSTKTLQWMFALIGKLLSLNDCLVVELTESSTETLSKGFGMMLLSRIPNQIIVWLQTLAVVRKCLLNWHSHFSSLKAVFVSWQKVFISDEHQQHLFMERLIYINVCSSGWKAPLLPHSDSLFSLVPFKWIIDHWWSLMYLDYKCQKWWQENKDWRRIVWPQLTERKMFWGQKWKAEPEAQVNFSDMLKYEDGGFGFVMMACCHYQ